MPATGNLLIPMLIKMGADASLDKVCQGISDKPNLENNQPHSADSDSQHSDDSLEQNSRLAGNNITRLR